jgi:DNA-binding transcriptional MerR regulator
MDIMNVLKIMRIREAAQRIGCSTKWLRLAEAEGRIPKANRDANNWRYYTEEDILRIQEKLLNKEDDSWFPLFDL